MLWNISCLLQLVSFLLSLVFHREPLNALFLLDPILILIQTLQFVASLMPHLLLLLTHSNARNPCYDLRKGRAIDIAAITRSAAIDSSMRALISARLFLDMNGLRSVASNCSCFLTERTLFLASRINLVSPALVHSPERQVKSWDLQASSRGETTGPFQSRLRSSYS